ncbi:hypothetical protein ACSSS7_003320 [Eimeria intestinalis]
MLNTPDQLMPNEPPPFTNISTIGKTAPATATATEAAAAEATATAATAAAVDGRPDDCSEGIAFERVLCLQALELRGLGAPLASPACRTKQWVIPPQASGS